MRRREDITILEWCSAWQNSPGPARSAEKLEFRAGLNPYLKLKHGLRLRANLMTWPID